MNDIIIPPVVVEALRENILRNCSFERAMREALKVWPMATTEHRELLNFGNNIDGPIVSARRVPFLILPLPTQETDA